MENKLYIKNPQFWRFVALFVGNAIGAGMLILPISMGLSGMIPSLLHLLMLVLISVFAAFILIDESSHVKDKIFDSPMILRHVLGEKLAWLGPILLYMFLTSALTAYIVGGAKIVCDVLHCSGDNLLVFATFGLTLILISCLDLSYIAKFNSTFTLLIFVCFLYLFIRSVPYVDLKRLNYVDSAYASYTVPVLMTSIGFNNIVPSMFIAMNRDVKQARACVVIAIILVSLCIIGWGLAVSATVPLYTVPNAGEVLYVNQPLPESTQGTLLAAQYYQQPSTIPLSIILKSHLVTFIGVIFSLCALVTSFFGIAISLRGVIRDVLVHSFNSDNKIVQILISFSLPFIIALLNPNSFITVMNNFAGPLYILLFIVFPLILAIRNRGYAVWKRALSCVFLLITLLIIFANVCATLGIWEIHPKAEKEYRELYVNPATAPQNQK